MRFNEAMNNKLQSPLRKAAVADQEIAIRGYRGKLSMGTIERTTKTQIVASDGKRYRRRDGCSMGDEYAFQATTIYLLTPEVKAYLAEAAAEAAAELEISRERKDHYRHLDDCSFKKYDLETLRRVRAILDAEDAKMKAESDAWVAEQARHG